MVCAKLVAYFQVWLPVFTRMCHQCVEKRAMTPPRGPMDAQTDPWSRPTEPKRDPNKPQHEHHEFPKLSHVRPEVSNTMVAHGLYMLLCSTALVHPHAAPMCPDLQTHIFVVKPSLPNLLNLLLNNPQILLCIKCRRMENSSPNYSGAPAGPVVGKLEAHFDSRIYRHPSNQHLACETEPPEPPEPRSH